MKIKNATDLDFIFSVLYLKVMKFDEGGGVSYRDIFNCFLSDDKSGFYFPKSMAGIDH